MHDIQKTILRKLMLSKKAKYSELKPAVIEGNLFSYHLQVLTKEKFIELKSGKYSLTFKGKRYVDGISTSTFSTRAQPKIVTFLVLKDKGKYLLYKRQKMPFIDRVGFPYGKMHLEEYIGDAAKRELLEKTGLTARLKHRGIIYLTVHSENENNEAELVSQMLCHIFSGTKITGNLIQNNPEHNCFWSKLENYKKDNLIPGVLQIEKLLKQNKTKFFFAEFFLSDGE
ncbi:MAG: NUDIX domain-containing protein [bacterium]